MRIERWIGGGFGLAIVLTLGCGRGGAVSPLAAAAASGNETEVLRLIADGALVNGVDGTGQTPLIAAARNDQAEIIRLLVEAGASVNAPDQRSTRWTPLVHAIHKRGDRAAVALLDAGAEPDSSLAGGATPLMFAAAYGNVELVRQLLARGADPRAVTSDGINALWAAAGGGGLFDITDGPPIGTCYPEIVDLLLEKAPELRVPTGFSTRVIHAFAADNCDALLSRLESTGS